MKKRLTKEEWKELIDKINSGELNITEGSKIFKVSRMQIYRKLRELEGQPYIEESKSKLKLWDKVKRHFKI